MRDWAWLTPLGYVTAALIAGAFLIWNNRQRSHDTLKTLVEIYDKLPESTARTALLDEIERRLLELSAARSDESGESRFEIEFDEELSKVPTVQGVIAFFAVLISLIAAMVPLFG